MPAAAAKPWCLAALCIESLLTGVSPCRYNAGCMYFGGLLWEDSNNVLYYSGGRHEFTTM